MRPCGRRLFQRNRVQLAKPYLWPISFKSFFVVICRQYPFIATNELQCRSCVYEVQASVTWVTK